LLQPRYGPLSRLRAGPSQRSASGPTPHGLLRLGFSFGIGTAGSCGSTATPASASRPSTPLVAGPVIRLLANRSKAVDTTPVFDAALPVTTIDRWVRFRSSLGRIPVRGAPRTLRPFSRSATSVAFNAATSSGRVRTREPWLYVTAFVSPATGECFWYVSNGVSKPFFEALLLTFAAKAGAGRDRIIVLVLDNASWHGASALSGVKVDRVRAISLASRASASPFGWNRLFAGDLSLNHWRCRERERVESFQDRGEVELAQAPSVQLPGIPVADRLR